jgi:hypothetical protein
MIQMIDQEDHRGGFGDPALPAAGWGRIAEASVDFGCCNAEKK